MQASLWCSRSYPCSLLPPTRILRLVPNSPRPTIYHRDTAETLAGSFTILPSAGYAVGGRPSSSFVPAPLHTRTRCTRSTERSFQPCPTSSHQTKPPLQDRFPRIPSISHIHNVVSFKNTEPQYPQAVRCTRFQILLLYAPRSRTRPMEVR